MQHLTPVINLERFQSPKKSRYFRYLCPDDPSIVVPLEFVDKRVCNLCLSSHRFFSKNIGKYKRDTGSDNLYVHLENSHDVYIQRKDTTDLHKCDRTKLYLYLTLMICIDHLSFNLVNNYALSLILSNCFKEGDIPTALHIST